MTRARRAWANVIYQGVDITADIRGDIISASYTDAFGEADRAEVVVQDRERKWLLQWKPTRGDTLAMSIQTEDWGPHGGLLPCGTFVVDQVRYAGRPTTATIGGVSTPADTDFVGVPKTRTWERVTLKNMAQSMLPAGMSLQFIGDDPMIEYVEQTDVADIAFITEQADKYGFIVKCTDRKLVLASAAELEAASPSFVITESDLDTWDLTADMSKTLYDGCIVRYKHPKTEEELEYTFMAPGATGNKLYEVTSAVASVAEAELVAKAELRKQNTGETGLSFTLMGRTDVYAGQTCALSGFGDFDARYFIDKSAHTLSDGYKTTVDMHRCLEGY